MNKRSGTSLLGRLWQFDQLLDQRLYAGSYEPTIFNRVGAIIAGCLNLALAAIFFAIATAIPSFFGLDNLLNWLFVLPGSLVFGTAGIAATRLALKTLYKAIFRGPH